MSLFSHCSGITMGHESHKLLLLLLFTGGTVTAMYYHNKGLR